jgi:hypothetical protein
MNYRLKLSMITFELLLEQYPKSYGKRFSGGVSMPNGDDSMRVIHSEDSLNNYRNEITKKYGDVVIELHSEEEIWFDRVRVTDPEFIQDQNNFCEAKARAMDRWSKQGFNTD